MHSTKSLRMTKQRKTLLEELRKVCSHPTAIELYELVRKRLPHVSLGTVYRNLELMSDMGLIRKLETAGAQKRFDGRVEHHYHIRCVRCHRVEDVALDPMLKIDQALMGVSDYEVLWHTLEFVGLCPSCQKKEGTRDSDNTAGASN